MLEIPVVYLSRYLIQHKAEYYRRLRAVTEDGDWEGWLLYMLQGIEETARWTTGRIEAIRALMDETGARVRKELPGYYSHELLELVHTQPYCRIEDYVRAGLGHRETASIHLNALVEVGVLEKERVGRQVAFIYPALLEVLRQ